MRESLTPGEARRAALAAQGFTNSPRTRQRRPFDPALERLHVLQIDSVNVFARSHHLPVFSRHGGYDSAALDRQLWGSGEYTEYWAHEAAFIPVRDRRLFQWRMDDFRERHTSDGRAKRLGRMAQYVREALADRGPQFVRDLEQAPRQKSTYQGDDHQASNTSEPPKRDISQQPAPRGGWWDWSETKQAVEMLFAQGEVVVAGREGFRRQYALAEQVLPAATLEPVPRAEAQRALVEKAALSLGVATLADLADYHRLKISDARVATRDLEDAGVLLPVSVGGWTRANGEGETAWLHRDARVPSRLSPDALLTPFDPVVWFRPRAERMFDFHYRIEIYTPKAKRQYGYYCLPLMVSGKLAGRIDLKADRTGRALLVQAAWQEPNAPSRTPAVARELLRQAATWQKLDEIRATGVGNLDLDL